jgi:fatty-acid desaturase
MHGLKQISSSIALTVVLQRKHHAFPRSAFHGLRWWQFDLSGSFIWALERLGLAKEVYRVAPAQQKSRAAKVNAKYV